MRVWLFLIRNHLETLHDYHVYLLQGLLWCFTLKRPFDDFTNDPKFNDRLKSAFNEKQSKFVLLKIEFLPQFPVFEDIQNDFPLRDENISEK